MLAQFPIVNFTSKFHFKTNFVWAPMLEVHLFEKVTFSNLDYNMLNSIIELHS